MALRAGRMVIDVDANDNGVSRQVAGMMRRAGRAGGHGYANAWAQEISKQKPTFESAMRGVAARISGILSANKSVRSFSDAWKDLGHNTKQWTLIIGAVAAGMQQIAVLGSAAAAGLLVVGGAATGAVVGLGAAIAAFAVLGREMEDIPESIRPAAQAFKDLKTPLKELQNFLAERAFAGTERAFASIGETIRRLTPAFGPLGDAINRIVNGFADWAASDEGIRLMTGLIEKSAPIFERIVGIVGKVGKALLIAFNNPKFQKALGDMLTGIEGLFDNFTEFVSSDEFGTWIEQTAGVLESLGGLLSATSDMFSDLVTPEAYERTRKFLDNLAEFMPHLGAFLDILGRLDIFGIIAEALVALGDALSPLAEPFGRIAEALGEIITIAIDTWGEQLKGVAEALAPLADAFADFLEDVDPETVKGLASALGILVAGIALFKTIQWLGMISGLTGFFGSIAKGNGIVKSFNVSKLKNIAKGFGVFAILGATQLIPDEWWEQFNIESNLPDTILTGVAFGSMFGVWGAVIGAGVGIVVSLFTEFEATMNDIGFSMLSLFSTGPFGLLGAIIADFFANLVPEEWQGSNNPFEALIAAAAFLVTDTGTAIMIVLEEVTRFFSEADANLKTFTADFIEGWGNLWGNINNPALWDTVGTSIETWLNGLATAFTTVTSGIGAGWNAFWAPLVNPVIETANKVGAAVQGMVNAIRNHFQAIPAAAATWNAFWSNLPNVVGGAVSRIVAQVNNLISAVQRALGAVGGLSRSAGGVLGGNGGGGAAGGSFASGGILGGPRRILAGESGAEAIVPLTRPLSQVDPSVRWLSALAQGRTPSFANGGVVGGASRTNNVEAGAIVIQEAASPLATGVEVLNRLAENLI